MADQHLIDPLAARLDQIIDAHREVMLPDGRNLLATERNALVTFARANGRRSRKLWRWVEISDHGRVTKADLAWCLLDDITALARCTQIQTLFLSCNQISDISALTRCGELVKLELGLNELRDISALASCRRLEKLSLIRNEVADISALAACARLTDLDLRYNRLADISALASCSMLERVNLGFNHRLSDISALESCPRLRRVDVLGTHPSETSAALIGKLQARGVTVTPPEWRWPLPGVRLSAGRGGDP